MIKKSIITIIFVCCSISAQGPFDGRDSYNVDYTKAGFKVTYNVCEIPPRYHGFPPDSNFNKCRKHIVVEPGYILPREPSLDKAMMVALIAVSIARLIRR